MINNTEPIKLFVLGSKNINVSIIEKLLDDNGVFEIEDSFQEIVDVNKKRFLSWYRKKLLKTKIYEVNFDQCIGCSFGKSVVLFNNGTFPKIPKKFTDNTKTGIMFEVSEGKICRIRLCIKFLKTENKTVFQSVGSEVAKNIKADFSDEESVAMYDANPDSEFSYITRAMNNKKQINENHPNYPFDDESSVPF